MDTHHEYIKIKIDMAVYTQRRLYVCAQWYWVAKRQRIPYLYRSLSAKEPYDYWQKSPMIVDSSAERDLQVSVSYASLPPCRMERGKRGERKGKRRRKIEERREEGNEEEEETGEGNLHARK